MSWFLMAIGAPFLWSVVNIADSYMVTKYSEKNVERSSGGLVLFSCFIAIIIDIVIGLFTKNIFHVGYSNILLLIIAGILNMLWFFPYLYAIEIEDISTISSWFLAVPIFGYILGYIFLGETLTFNQGVGSIIIILGLLILSFDFEKKNKKLKRKSILYMILSCLLIAISGIIFKYVTIEDNFWISSFWEYFGSGLIGIIIYIFASKYRKEFNYMSKLGRIKIFTISGVCEILAVSGNLLTNFALLLAPVVMVYLIGNFQPAIVLILTVLGTKYFPHIIKEDISKKTLIPKIVAIFIMIAGSMLLIQ